MRNNHDAEDVPLYREDIDHLNYGHMLIALSIMRRWQLSASRVVDDYVLRGVLDQHVENGTDPISPREG